jgi:ArsR family transcriptional regulator, arsenate/arsenite/antimonite-responsive transcriptional repressor
MKRSKNKTAPDQTHEMIALFRALSDPSRFRLVKLLAARPKSRAGDGCGDGPLCVNALAHQLNITQSAVSQHLRVLRNIGLVRGERRGAFVHYTVELDLLDRVLQALRGSLGI